jgi:hypothetical protein
MNRNVLNKPIILYATLQLLSNLRFNINNIPGFSATSIKPDLRNITIFSYLF